MLQTFRKFNNLEAAIEVGEILKNNHIPYQTSDNFRTFDPTMANNKVGKEYYIQLDPADFKRATALLLQETEKQLDEVDRDYPLLSFTDAELMEVIVKPFDWTEFDVLLAQKLLKERGKEVSKEFVEVIKAEKEKELAQPERVSTTWLAAAYISVLTGGLLGVLMGYHFMSHKKALPNGTMIPAFVPEHRLQGKIIFFLGLLVLATSIYLVAI